VAYLKTYKCNGNLFNDFDYGGYLIWKLPEYKIFIDGRMQAWDNPQGKNYFDIYQQVLSNASFRNSTFNQYHITCALVGIGHKTFIKQLEAQHWQPTVKANQAILLTAPR
jgi:hypothetical protein